MTQPAPIDCDRASAGPKPAPEAIPSGLGALPVITTREVACCGGPAGEPSASFERPGYQVHHFVASFQTTPAGEVPIVQTHLNRRDRLGTLMVRLGIRRGHYRLAPGLYGVGEPGPDSPVLVTANYNLSFDALRRQLSGLDAWILVLDTRGINVWCAAGHELFSTREVVRQIERTALNQVVRHRRIILPQLSATGVSARSVKQVTGFEVVWGPVRAGDLQAFIAAGLIAETSARRVTFDLVDRFVLVPVEINLKVRSLAGSLLVIFILSGIGPSIFSLNAAWSRGLMGAAALLAGFLAGGVLTPVLLPWLPGRAFSLKGAVIGGLTSLIVVYIVRNQARPLELFSLILMTTTVSSFMAMNFTGATPFTSPSGVEKEMRRAIPAQIAALVIAIIVWLSSGFIA